MHGICEEKNVTLYRAFPEVALKNSYDVRDIKGCKIFFKLAYDSFWIRYNWFDIIFECFNRTDSHARF